MDTGIPTPIAGLAILLTIILVPLFLGSIVWAFGDAKTRGKSGCLVAILVAFLSWPLGLIAWLIFRPDETKSDTPQTVFIQCECGRQVPVCTGMAGTKVVCPSCGTGIVVPELSRFRRIVS